MRTKALLIGCCMMVILNFSGCRSAEQKEVPAENETKREAVSENTSKNAVSKNSTSGNTPAQSQNVNPQKTANTPGTQGGGEDIGSLGVTPAEAVQEGTDLGQETDGTANEESMQQCPYCGEWFSTAPDGDLWNPYDRHLLEERDTSQAEEQAYEYPDDGETADGELVQCPDCGNWYEEGNVFRNHICEGRTYPDEGETADGEMVQCPDCGNWYEEGNVFRNHICEGR